MAERTIHYTAAGFKPQLIAIAPDAEDILSKRYDIIEEEDKNLNRNLGELEEGTRARNREFQRRLNEVWSQTSGWEAKLVTEEKEAEESINHIKMEYQRHMKEFETNFLSDVRKSFKDIDDLTVPQNDRVTAFSKDLNFFFKETVPQTIEAQSGEVSRQLKKQYETFDIEKQKGKKKERKFISKAEEHIQTTAQKFTDEAALMSASFFNLEEDIIYNERRSSRMHIRRYDNAAKATVELNTNVQAMAEKRRLEDIDILDTIIETQGLLQTTILEHFGSEHQAKSFGEKPNFKKLESRIASRGASRAGSRSGSSGKGSEPQKVASIVAPHGKVGKGKK